MGNQVHAAEARHSPGGLIRIQAQFTRMATRLVPTWAAICGVVASHGFGGGPDQWLRLGVLALLVDAGWGTLWSSLGGTDWATPVREWRDWRIGGKLPTLPYAQAGSRGDRFSRWMGQFRAWWRQDLWPACGLALSAAVAALLVTALLAALLGAEVLLLSLAAIAAVQLSAVWTGGRGTPSPGWDAAVAVFLPWLAGHAAFGALTMGSAALAAFSALAYAAAWWARSLWGQVLLACCHIGMAAVLIGLQHPLAGAGVLMLLVPQLALAPFLRRGYPLQSFVRFTRPWLMVTMVIGALVI